MAWDEVQAIGGFKVEAAALTKDGRVRLSLRCNVAGVESVTVAPREMNSGLGVASVQTTVTDSSVFFTVLRGPGSPAACPSVETMAPKADVLRVVYRDPDGAQHPLGRVRIDGAASVP
jgi:hypothetical protein